MKILLPLSFTLLLNIISIAVNGSDPIPAHIHISYGDLPNEMRITWVTWQSTNPSQVEYWPASSYSKSELETKQGILIYGTEQKYIDEGQTHRAYYIHRVQLTKLQAGKTYYYRCGSASTSSSIYQFSTPPVSNWAPKFAVFGDMGVDNAQILETLKSETERGAFDFVLHAGDMAYNLEDEDGRRGDAFMESIQPIAARLPYMTAVGNHENAYNFSYYQRSFSMPIAQGDGHNLFFSFNVGPAHVIIYSTEFYYFTGYGWQQIVNQYHWLEKDLEEANKNRHLRPWVIAIGHRPMYCSNIDSEHCFNIENYVRVGIPFPSSGNVYLYSLEELFYTAGVDLLLYGHKHGYERFWPVYYRRVCNGSDPRRPYRNPPAPVHIVTGAAGNHEDLAPFAPLPLPWTAFRALEYSYTVLTVHNSTHLESKQISTYPNVRQIDSFVIEKATHGANTYNCE